MGKFHLLLLGSSTAQLASDKLCPSEYIDNDVTSGCWTFRDGGCFQTNPDCVKINCLNDGLEATIRPDTFGIPPSDFESYEKGTSKLSVNGNECSALTWDKEQEMFVMKAGLFDCDVDVSEAIQDDKSYLAFKHSILKEQMHELFMDQYFVTMGSVRMDLECRYSCEVTTNSADLTVIRPTSAPEIKHELELKFELDVKTTYATHDDLQKADSNYFKAVATEVVTEVDEGWQGLKPWKIEVGHFIFYYDDLAAEERAKENEYKKYGPGGSESKDKSRRSADNETEDTGDDTGNDDFDQETEIKKVVYKDENCATDDQLVKVNIKIHFKYLTEETEPTEDEVNGFKGNIVHTVEKIQAKPDSIIDPCWVPDPNVITDPDVIDVSQVTIPGTVAPTTIHLEDSVLGYGSWQDGFSVDLFEDKDHSIPLVDTLLGNDMFVKVSWQSKYKELNFFVRDCKYVCPDRNGNGEHDLEIVKDTCYAELVNARYTTPGDEKVVTSDSSFALRSFNFVDGKNHCEVCCTVRTCVIKDGTNTCKPPTECPNNALKYTPFGKRE